MPDDEKKSEITFAMCGPGSKECKCNCPDGPCEHQWDGPEVRTENGGSVSCSKCGMLAIDHALWTAP